MNKEEIKQKILIEKRAKLIDILEFNGKYYTKTLIISEGEKLAFEYKYYEIINEKIEDIPNLEIEEIKNFFETNLGNIVY